MEWIQTHIVAIVVAVTGWVAGLITAAVTVAWKFSTIASDGNARGEQLDKLVNRLEKHIDEFDDHTRNADVHTTWEQRQAYNARFDRIEQSIATGHERIEAKIDRWAERMLKG